MCFCVCMCGGACLGVQVAVEAGRHRLPWSWSLRQLWTTPYGMGAGTWSWVLQKSSAWSQPRSHPSSVTQTRLSHRSSNPQGFSLHRKGTQSPAFPSWLIEELFFCPPLPGHHCLELGPFLSLCASGCLEFLPSHLTCGSLLLFLNSVTSKKPLLATRSKYLSPWEPHLLPF